jgi:outer membrane protein assembly factor BamD (BamD/ComL family)
MKRAGYIWLLFAGCVHAGATHASPSQAVVPREVSAADLAYQAAAGELGAARYQEARPLFKTFAEKFPTDPRAATARLQEAFAALGALDQVQGLDEAQAVLAQLPPETDAAALRELRALILTRAQALQAQAAVAQVLSECQADTGQLIDRERAQSKAQVGKLQTELQRRERTLDQVKQRLLEIQQLATEMLGAPLPQSASGDKPSGDEGKGSGDSP